MSLARLHKVRRTGQAFSGFTTGEGRFDSLESFSEFARNTVIDCAIHSGRNSFPTEVFAIGADNWVRKGRREEGSGPRSMLPGFGSTEPQS
jgi:hypothetical protein